MILGAEINGLRLGKRRLGDFLEFDGRIFEMRLLADGVPLIECEFIGGARPAGIIPISEMERKKKVAWLDLADRDLRLYMASPGRDANPVTIFYSQL